MTKRGLAMASGTRLLSVLDVLPAVQVLGIFLGVNVSRVTWHTACE